MKKKAFDCVEMKNRIQESIARKNEGLTDDEVRRRRRALLETSDDPLARKWRSLRDSKDGA